jgi:hypothetical protein
MSTPVQALFEILMERLDQDFEIVAKANVAQFSDSGITSVASRWNGWDGDQGSTKSASSKYGLLQKLIRIRNEVAALAEQSIGITVRDSNLQSAVSSLQVAASGEAQAFGAALAALISKLAKGTLAIYGDGRSVIEASYQMARDREASEYMRLLDPHATLRANVPGVLEYSLNGAAPVRFGSHFTRIPATIGDIVTIYFPTGQYRANIKIRRPAGSTANAVGVAVTGTSLVVDEVLALAEHELRITADINSANCAVNITEADATSAWVVEIEIHGTVDVGDVKNLVGPGVEKTLFSALWMHPGSAVHALIGGYIDQNQVDRLAASMSLATAPPGVFFSLDYGIALPSATYARWYTAFAGAVHAVRMSGAQSLVAQSMKV